MNYDLTKKDERRKFVQYANRLLAKERTNVRIVDESHRTLSQNCYIHVLCRILAVDIGVTEYYAKQVYFKECANKDLFVRITKDSITGEMVKIIRSTTELTIQEMRKAISNFRQWAFENGYYLPEANLNDDGTMSFASDVDKDAFHDADIKTSKLESVI